VDAVELPLRLRGIADALRTRVPAAAANAMAAEFHGELVDVTLRQSTHPSGTVTTAPPGQPPALVSGTLRRSARIVPAAGGSARATASVRMGAVYSRIHELGGFVFAKRGKKLAFEYPRGHKHFVRWVYLPKRPYMAPTRERLVSSGRLRDRGKQAAMDVIRSG
jgi:phage gpG-like protein